MREDESGFRVIRPILDIKREEIERYCEEKGLEPRRDHTNEEALYSRNKIRLELIPYLAKEYNSNIVDTLNRLGRLSAEDRAFLNRQAAEAYEETLIGENVLDIRKLNEMDPALRKRVYVHALNAIGMTENITEKHLLAVDRLRASLNHPEAVAELTEGFRVAKKKKELRFYRI